MGRQTGMISYTKLQIVKNATMVKIIENPVGNPEGLSLLCAASVCRNGASALTRRKEDQIERILWGCQKAAARLSGAGKTILRMPLLNHGARRALRAPAEKGRGAVRLLWKNRILFDPVCSKLARVR